MCRRRSAGVRAARLGVFCCRERPLGSRAAVSTFRGSVFGNGVHTGCLAEWRTWAIRASPSLPRQGTDMLINCMKVEGLLSFGREGIDLPMEPLNVLIGPNGSGKSNLLEVLALLQAAPRAFSEPINRGGGVQEWLWKGEEPPGRAYVEVEIAFPAAGALRHALTFVDRAGRPELVDERIEPATAPPAGDRAVFYCRPPRSEHAIARMRAAVPPPTIQEAGEAVGNVPPRNVAVEHAGGIQFAGDFRPEQSLLSFATPLHQALWFLSEQYGRIRLYRNWSFGPTAPLRRPASAHDPTDFLIEGGANLPLVLSNFHGSAKRRFVEALGELFDGIIDVSCPVTGGTVALFLEERDGRQIPASRLSDGTLRYLGLLAVLLHPDPPPLIAIDEPDLGLHPDVVAKVAELLVDASERTQIVVTTHSRMLLDALSDRPSSVVVCEEENGQSRFERLDSSRLRTWLKDYSLGELWGSGELGGNRW